MTTQEMFAVLEKEVEELNSAYRLETPERNIAIENARDNLESSLEVYNNMLKGDAYARFKASENPMIEAIKALNIRYLKLCENKVGDSVTSVSLYNKDGNLNEVSKIINLADFDKYTNYTASKDKNWRFMIERFNQLMCLKVAYELGTGAEDIVNKTFYLSDKAKQIKSGKTPHSNTAVLKDLQSLIDAIIYEDNNGKNKYKATSHDVAYIDKLYAKKSKTALSVQCANASLMRELILKVLYRIVTEQKYDVEYKKVTTK